ncbi:MAG: hypothetical protein R3Y23_03655 [Bacillota bacterium]
MESIDKLEKTLEELKKIMQKVKKEDMMHDDFLHSGELSMMKFIFHYNQRFDKNPTLVYICGVIGVSGATATNIADRLINKGYIKKEVSNLDKRAKILSLTESGKVLLLSNRARYKEKLGNLISVIGDDDINELHRIITKINKHFIK